MSDGGYGKFGSATKNTMCNVETVIKKTTIYLHPPKMRVSTHHYCA